MKLKEDIYLQFMLLQNQLMLLQVHMLCFGKYDKESMIATIDLMPEYDFIDPSSFFKNYEFVCVCILFWVLCEISLTFVR